MGTKKSTDMFREKRAKLTADGTHVVLITGETWYGDIVEEAGADFLLEKPVALDTLVGLVGRLVMSPDLHIEHHTGRQNTLEGEKLQSKIGNWHRLLVLVVVLAMPLTACGGAPVELTSSPTTVSRTTLTISGSGTTAAVLSGIKPAFEADVPGYTLEVLPGSGTGGGVKGLTEGILDVAAMARPPKDEEAAQGTEYVEFGQSGAAVYTHPGVGVTY